jgi:hypothetical protein
MTGNLFNKYPDLRAKAVPAITAGAITAAAALLK